MLITGIFKYGISIIPEDELPIQYNIAIFLEINTFHITIKKIEKYLIILYAFII